MLIMYEVPYNICKMKSTEVQTLGALDVHGCLSARIDAQVSTANAARKNELLIKCLTCSFLLVPDLNIATTVALSQRQCFDFPCHILPHISTPTTTGSYSFIVMLKSRQDSGHSSWNHSPDDVKAPHRHEPDAS